jgi:hypothetical protein
LESDLSAVLVFDWCSGQTVHLVGGGIQRCGALVVVDDPKVTS